jgi:hypothetical protein
MKYLKVEESKAHFCLEPETTAPVWKSIDEITKDDLMALLNRAVSPGFEMDEYNETLLQNKAHQIIYKRIHHKFTELLSKTDVFNDEIENTYKNALEKYSPPPATSAISQNAISTSLAETDKSK